MKLKGKITDVNLDFVTHSPKITIQVDKQVNILNDEFNKLQEKELLEIELKPFRERRSLNANAYAWALINEMANVLRTSKEEIYLLMLKRYGQSEIISVLSSIDITGYFKYYEVAGTSVLNDKEFTHYKVYKGSSEYDSREMSVLIDGIVSEAKTMNIEVLTPMQLYQIKNEWSV